MFGFTEAGLIRLLIVNVTGLLTDTPVAPLTGFVPLTVNDPPPNATVPVVKVLVNGVTGLPAWSVNPLTCTVYAVVGASAPPGVKVSVVWSALRVIVPLTGVPPVDTVIAELPMLTALTGALITATT